MRGRSFFVCAFFPNALRCRSFCTCAIVVLKKIQTIFIYGGFGEIGIRSICISMRSRSSFVCAVAMWLRCNTGIDLWLRNWFVPSQIYRHSNIYTCFEVSSRFFLSKCRFFQMNIPRENWQKFIDTWRCNLIAASLYNSDTLEEWHSMF